MNEFKQCMMQHIGVGGNKCSCCNQFHGKVKKKLNRMARAKLSINTKKIIDKESGNNEYLEVI